MKTTMMMLAAVFAAGMLMSTGCATHDRMAMGCDGSCCKDATKCAQCCTDAAGCAKCCKKM